MFVRRSGTADNKATASKPASTGGRHDTARAVHHTAADQRLALPADGYASPRASRAAAPAPVGYCLHGVGKGEDTPARTTSRHEGTHRQDTPHRRGHGPSSSWEV